MLADLIQRLVTPAPLAHRRLGCVGDSVRLASRSRRCRAAWAPHLSATRDIIREAIASTRMRDTAVVLGSGLLDDVPIAELAAVFRQVVLVDAVHPWRSRLRTRRFPNVVRLAADLSGSFALLAGRARTLVEPLPAICRKTGTDLVISVNLLSQLPIRPVELLENRRRPAGLWHPEQGDAFGRAIVGAHLAALDTLDARVCLVSDVEEVVVDRDGHELKRTDLLFGARLPETERRWVWSVAPLGEAGRGRATLHHVVGYPDRNPARV